MDQRPTEASPSEASKTTEPLNFTVCVMGVSGCGKSTVASMIAEHFSVPFCEADDLHPEANVQKMASGTPLDDADREPWLIAVRDKIKKLRDRNGESSPRGCVVACSALKKSYRDILSGAELNTVFVHLAGSFDLIFERIQQRDSHFMPASLLRSQFDALEAPMPGPTAIELSIDDPPEEIASEAIKSLIARI